MTDASAAGSALPRVADATTELAHRYAEALIGAAEKEGGVEPVLEELGEIERDVLKAFPRFAELLASPRVSSAHKDQILTEVFGKARLEPGLTVPAGLESPRATGNARCRGPRGPRRSGTGAITGSRFTFARPFRLMRNSCKHSVTGSPP